MIKDIYIPDIGEKVESGLVVGILVSVGEMVEVDQAIIEIETDKAVVEIPSPEKGTIAELLVKVDDEVRVGQVIARIDTADKSITIKEETAEKAGVMATAEAGEKAMPVPEGESAGPVPDRPAPEPEAKAAAPPGKAAPAAPAVRRLARELGADINRVMGTGPSGRITRDDVKGFVKKIIAAAAVGPVREPAVIPLPDFSRWGEVYREPMSKVRSITADTMAHAWTTIPHVTQFDRADITELEKFRKKFSRQVEEAGGKLTVTAILLKVVAAALQRFPRFNASLDMERREIIYKKYYHIAVAVETDRGLLVPVVTDVDKKSIIDLAVELTDIAERTRNKRITPDELDGGTFTISNQGGIGGTNFTPIVYWPQVAILGVSRSSVQPKFAEGEFSPCTILPLSLSYDHRAIDGADAARFLRWVVDALEHPLLLNLEG